MPLFHKTETKGMNIMAKNVFDPEKVTTTDESPETVTIEEDHEE